MSLTLADGICLHIVLTAFRMHEGGIEMSCLSA